MIQISTLKKELKLLNKLITETYTKNSSTSKNFIEASDILIAYYIKNYDELGIYYTEILEEILYNLSKELPAERWKKIKGKIPTAYEFITIMKKKYRTTN